MTQSIIIGIHGLLNKPPENVLGGWWRDAIAEGLNRNNNVSLEPPLAQAYWANIRNPEPIAVDALDEKYEEAAGQGSLKSYIPGKTEKARAVLQKWGGRVLDKEKELFGLGKNIERLLGVKFDDLADYYDDSHIRQQIRSRLSDVLEQHQDKRILLIAHSMGSIVGYDVMRQYDSKAINIEHFITIGSPLGLPLVTSKIREEFAATQTPTSVNRWTNLADPGDKVALDCNLADEYRSHNGIQVTDVLVHNEYINHEGKANNHKSYGYLRTPELSNLIRDFLV